MTDKQIIDGVDVSGCEKQGETIAGLLVELVKELDLLMK